MNTRAIVALVAPSLLIGCLRATPPEVLDSIRAVPAKPRFEASVVDVTIATDDEGTRSVRGALVLDRQTPRHRLQLFDGALVIDLAAAPSGARAVLHQPTGLGEDAAREVAIGLLDAFVPLDPDTIRGQEDDGSLRLEDGPEGVGRRVRVGDDGWPRRFDFEGSGSRWSMELGPQIRLRGSGYTFWLTQRRTEAHATLEDVLFEIPR